MKTGNIHIYRQLGRNREASMIRSIKYEIKCNWFTTKKEYLHSGSRQPGYKYQVTITVEKIKDYK